MKTKFSARVPKVEVIETETETLGNLPVQNEVSESILMSRLASGLKTAVDVKAMKRLTIKNYEKLPEIIKKKQEAVKIEELKAKKEKASIY